MLAAWIHPQRVSQIRVVYADPRAVRREGDSIVSNIGPWAHIISELEHEIAGSGPGDEESLAYRYQETLVPVFYIYFSAQILSTSGRSLFETWKF